MIFPYLYTDMSLKHVFLLSILSIGALTAHAFPEVMTPAFNDTIRFEDGSWYLGEISDSLFNGRGKMFYADSTVYEGDWKDGLWDGHGELAFPDGDSYSGEFRQHEFSGYGTYLYADGGKYEGYWENGMFNGAGTMEYPDGSIYSGEWKDDMKHGLGVYYYAPQRTLTKGYFRNDVFDMYYGLLENGPMQDDNSHTAQVSPAKPDDGKFHNEGLTEISLSFGTGQMLAIHADFHTSDLFFAGFQLGFNTGMHEIGEVSVTTDEETGERITLVDWDWYPNEILTEKTYQSVKISGECGLSWRRLSLGTALGIGLNNTIRNCRSREDNDSYYEAGTLYFRQKITGVKFAYDVFAQFVPKFNPWIDVSLRTGYSNIDRFYVGLGIIFNAKDLDW